MPLQATSGAASYDAFGGGVPVEPVYIEQIFSTYLYTGNGSTQTITNGIDLDGEGGLVWFKGRDVDNRHHSLYDTIRGVGNAIYTNQTWAQSAAGGVSSFNADGFALDSYQSANENTTKFVSWTFRKAEKFFDVVTWTGNGTAGRTVAHNLGSVPGCIIVKRTDTTGDWQVYHRANTANPETDYLVLNSTAATVDSNTRWNDTLPTDSVFSLGTEATVNASGGTYVAYLFAHDAGGFGLTGTDNVISCGSFTGNNTALQSINLGYEPQFLLIKSASIDATDWNILDNMRGVATNGVDAVLAANSSAAEASPFDRVDFTATGFNLKTSSALYNESGTYIYIAIRRGPMKVPESGTEVFDPSFRITGDPTIASGFVTDMGIVASRTGGGTTDYHLIGSRLTGNLGMTTTSANAEVTRGLEPLKWDYNNGWGGSDTASSFAVWYSFKRATGFFDVVAYSGTGVAGSTVAHNLGVAPELMIVKQRDTSRNWTVYSEFSGPTKYQVLNNILLALDSIGMWNNTSPTASIFTVGDSGATNASAGQYIAYLFATLAGVSKVGSYTGTGADLNVDCGFSAGARFILIKRTDDNGDWYVWDSVRGIVAGNDPYLLLNSTAAEVTSTDYIDTASTGFEISSTAPAAINANGGTFIFLAIA